MFRIIFISLFILTAFFSFGQKYYSQNIEIEDEVPISSIYDIQKDSLNRLWIATDIGIILYNGVSIEFFNEKNGLLDNTILKIHIDDEGIIWFATLSGKIFFYKDNQFQSTPFLSSLDTICRKSYYNIEVKNNHLLLLGNKGEAFNVDLKKEIVHKYNYINRDTNNQYNLLIKKDSIFEIIEFMNYIFVDSSICEQIDSSILAIGLKVRTNYTYISSFWVNMGDSTLLTFGSKFIILRNNKIVDERNIEGNPEIISILNNGNEIWFGTFAKGIYVYSRNSKTLSALNVLKNKSVSSMLRVSSDKIAVGTLSDGVKILRQENIVSLFDTIGFISAVRYPNIIANSQTKIYSINIPNKDIEIIYDYKEGICNKVIQWSDDIVMAYGNRLLSINEDNNIDILSYEYITCVKRTEDKTYIGYPYSKIDIRNNNLDYIGTYKILKKNRTNVIQEYGNKIYFGTRDGLFVMNDTSKAIVEKVSNNRVASMLKIKDDIFIGTRFSGLVIMNQDSLSKLYSFGYKSLEIKDILELDNKIYLSTNYGLIIADYKNDSILNHTIISRSDGLKSSMVNSAFVYGDSIIISTSKGLYMIHKDYKPVVEIPNIYLENVSYNGMIGEKNGKIVLTPYDNSVVIKYGSSVYNLDGKVEFYYRLVQDGIQWHKVSTQRLSVFNLDPGNYNFEIYSKVKNKNSKILKLSFIVDKPFYLKWWAILIFVFIIVSAIIYIIKYRRRKKKLEVRLLQNELDMIQKQLNPHFVSNALNSLQSLILDDDFVKTNIFISNFSSLLRFSLRYSKKLFIGLSEELNYIESFIKLHQITNRKRFKYEIYLSKEVELIARDILVPPFFMQPIIENAIVHGFDNSSSDNILVIEVVLNDDFVEVRIVDNGIGYNNADDNNKGSGRGISSIMERIVIYKDLEDYKISFSIGNSEILDFGTIAQLIFEKRINDERKV